MPDAVATDASRSQESIATKVPTVKKPDQNASVAAQNLVDSPPQTLAELAGYKPLGKEADEEPQGKKPSVVLPPEEAARRLKQRIAEHRDVRGVLTEIGLEFLPKERRVVLPPIVSRQGIVNMEQVGKLVPNTVDSEKYPDMPPAPTELRQLAVADAIQVLFSYLRSESIVTPIGNDQQRDWRREMAQTFPDIFTQVYENNQLRGNKLGGVVVGYLPWQNV